MGLNNSAEYMHNPALWSAKIVCELKTQAFCPNRLVVVSPYGPPLIV